MRDENRQERSSLLDSRAAIEDGATCPATWLLDMAEFPGNSGGQLLDMALYRAMRAGM
jgi:hypothetical protein